VNWFRVSDAAPPLPRRPGSPAPVPKVGSSFPRCCAHRGPRNPPPLRGAFGVADGRALPLPPGPSPIPPRSRAPVAVWGDTPASTSASAQQEAAAPIYRAVALPRWSRPRPSASPCSADELPRAGRHLAPPATPAVTTNPWSSYSRAAGSQLCPCRAASQLAAATAGRRRRAPCRPLPHPQRQPKPSP
jgi:hypothetical protein